MKNKKLGLLLIGLLLATFLVACSVSKDYQGEWYALDGSGKQMKLNYSEKQLEIVNGRKYQLSQFGTGIENDMKYYQIKLDQEKFVLIFPDKKDKDNAVVIKPNDEDRPLEGKILFRMNRKSFPSKE
jgi:hypothetical protein